MTLKIIEINSQDGRILDPDWLQRAESTHRQLRPHLQDYSSTMSRVFADGGRMLVAISGDVILGVAVYRIYENTASGIHMYVDDLVTSEDKRSRGVGKALLDHLQMLAKQRECQVLTLDSATHRFGAHKFYFREGFPIVAFHFAKYFKDKR
jgi:GNAT superfamily N-acetyltransferase